MSEIINLDKIIFEKKKQKLEYTEEIFVPKQSILTCDGTCDFDGRIYRGRCKKEEVFIELDYLKSIGIYDIKLYPAYNNMGIIVPTHFAIFGRDEKKEKV